MASSQTRSFQVGSASVWSTGGTGRSHQDTSYFDIFIIIIHTLCTDVFPISSSISDSNNTQLGLLAPQTTSPASQSTNRIVLATQLSGLKSQSEHFSLIYIQNANIYTSTSGFRDKQTLKHRRSTSAHCFPSNPLKFAQLVKTFPLMVKWNPQKVHFICIVSFKPPVFQVKYRTHDFLDKEHNTICA